MTMEIHAVLPQAARAIRVAVFVEEQGFMEAIRSRERTMSLNINVSVKGKQHL